MKKRVLLLSALASVFMNLNADEIKEFTEGKKKFSKNNRIEIYPSKLSKTKDRKSWEYGKEQIMLDFCQISLSLTEHKNNPDAPFAHV